MSVFGSMHRRRRGRRSGLPGLRAGESFAARVSRLTRLERELDRACERYELAIAAIDERTRALQRLPSAREIVRAATSDEAQRGPDTHGPDSIRLSSVTFDDLRALGLSVTQSKRVLILREEGLLPSTAALDEVPGIPRSQLLGLKLRLRD
jgi:hypothetical protein